MDWERTLKRVCRKHGLILRDLEKAIGLTQIHWDRPNTITGPRLKIMAERIGIPVEVLYLEALRDSKNLPDEIRIEIANIINRINPDAGE